MKNIVSCIIYLILVSSCENKLNNESFELSEDLINSIEKNNSCLKLIDEGFGVDSNVSKEVNFIESLLSKVIKKNRGVKYQRLLFIRTYEEGEVTNTSKVTFGVLKNDDMILKNYSSGIKQKRIESRYTQKKGIDILYNKIGKPQNEIVGGRTKVFIIDFKSEDNFECILYDDVNRNIIKKINDLSLLD